MSELWAVDVARHWRSRWVAALRCYEMGAPLWRCVRMLAIGATGPWRMMGTRRGRAFWSRPR